MGAMVSILDSQGAPAQIFGSNNQNSSINNPILTGSLGEFSFFARNGRYRIENVSVGGRVFQTGYREIILNDPDDGAGGLPGRVGTLESSVEQLDIETEAATQALDALQLPDYAALRAYKGPRKSVYVTGVLGTAAPSGIAGMFVLDAADATTADNGGKVIVTADGKRFKRAGNGAIDVQWFGAKGDWNGTTGADDTAAIQAAIDACIQATDVAMAAGGAQATGGGTVIFPQTGAGYRITASLNVTKKKIRLLGPAKLILSDGVTGLAFQYAGSNAHSGCVVEGLDFVGGAVGVDVGDQAVPIPVAIYGCMFVNQTVAGVRVGQYGYGITIRDSLFNNCKHGVYSVGQASDSLLIDHNVFSHSTDYDIYIKTNNTTRITNNIFVLNKRASDPANIYLDTGTDSLTGAYTVISQNKFGPEGRMSGNCIAVAGTSGAMLSIVVRDNTFHYGSTATATCAIKVANKSMQGWTITGNSLAYCTLLDASTVFTNAATRDNLIMGNAVVAGNSGHSQILRSGHRYIEEIEPQTWDKVNILAWSRYINDGASFTYTNATPSYMTASDENGIANNATTVLATAASNTIRINQLNTNNKQKFYTFWLWLKLDAAGTVHLRATRGTNTAFDRTVTVGTEWQRITVEFYQTYYASGNPYAVEITIPNGATVTLGAVGCVPGRDVGDLFKTNQITERFGLGLFSSVAPSVAGGHSPQGRRVFNVAPAVGAAKGWICTAAGNPGTWVSEGNL